MNKSVYLDSTVLSFLYDERPEIQFLIDITKRWWKEEKKFYKIFISEETVKELGESEYPGKEQILKNALKLTVLPSNQEIIEIAQIYINNYLMPKELGGDALHLSYSSYYKMDFLLTWNCTHLANGNKKQHIRIINTRLGLYIPEIITPLELLNKEG
jgi:hypothetical protein